MAKPKTCENLTKNTTGAASSVTPTPTINLITNNTPTTNTPSTTPLPPSTTPSTIERTTPTASSSSSSALESMSNWVKVATSWPPLKMALVVLQVLDLLLALFHLIVPMLSKAYQKKVIFDDTAKYGEVGVPEAKWGPIFSHLFILLLLFVLFPLGELYCTLKDLLLASPGSSTYQQYYLMAFLATRGVAIAMLVYYTQNYPGYVFLLLANFAVTMILAYALFDARSKVTGSGGNQKGNKRNSSSLFADDALESPAVGVMSGTEDVSPIFAAQASRMGPAKSFKQSANNKNSRSSVKKGGTALKAFVV